MSEAEATGRACVTAATPSAKLVFAVLCHEGPKTQGELVEATRLSRDGVRSGVRALEACGVVTVEPDLRDARRKRYALTRPAACPTG